MFGGFAKEVEKIVYAEFRDGRGQPYVISNIARPALKEVAALMKRKGGNSYDAAILFMISQTETLHQSVVSPEISAWAGKVKQRCYELSSRGRIAPTILSNSKSVAPTVLPSSLDAAISSSTLMSTFIEKIGVYRTPLRLSKPPVVAYLYGWCDASIQLLKPSPSEGTAMMIAMFQDIYGRIRFANGQADESIGLDAYKRGIAMLQKGEDRYMRWFSLGGNEFHGYLQQEIPPVGILEALESMD